MFFWQHTFAWNLLIIHFNSLINYLSKADVLHAMQWLLVLVILIINVLDQPCSTIHQIHKRIHKLFVTYLTCKKINQILQLLILPWILKKSQPEHKVPFPFIILNIAHHIVNIMSFSSVKWIIFATSTFRIRLIKVHPCIQR